MNQRTLKRDDYGLRGLGATEVPAWAGDVVVLDKSSEYYNPATPAVTPKKDTWSVIDNILNIGQKTANVVSTVIPAKTKTVSIPGSGSTVQTIDIPPPVTQAKMSTTTKVLIGSGVALGVGTLGYFLFRKKGKKGLGCPEPAPALGGVKKKRSKKRKK